ncbi:hypothetical protein [Actinomadura miaoliensis]|uniref:Glycosyltransferase RgtA/B/C/D-like domain-containing protein n=1 Tax=Actinomadura miaoliensis TaxID=430685 RepID=A0ABP7WWA0_9ACTN
MTVMIDRARTVPGETALVPRRRRRSWPVWALVLGWALQVCVRLWFARARVGPVADPDESGYLTAARWLAGGPGGDLSGNTFYQGGYPLLLTPAFRLAHDPATVYTLVMVINALVGAALFPLGYMLLRRLGLDVRTALPSAWAGALLPGVTFFGAFVLADALLPMVVLAWLLSLDRFVRYGSAYAAAGASLLACYGHTVHSRGSVLVAVHVAVLGVLLWRRGTRRPLAVGAAATAAGYAAASLFNDMVRSALYPGGVRDLAGNVEGRITTLEGQAWAVSGAVGQLWYLVVGTWGLAGVGLTVVLVTLARRRTGAETRIMAGTLLATTLGIAYASSAALPDEHRVGNFAYGRYLTCVALVYALIGVTAVLRLSLAHGARAVAGATAVVGVTGLWVSGYAGERLRTHSFIGFDFPETSFLTLDRGAFHLWEASLAALGLLLGFSVLGRGRAPVLGVGLLAVNVAAMTYIMGPNPQRPALPPPFPGGRTGGVALDTAISWQVRTKLLFPVSWTRMSSIDTRTQQPARGVCTVVVNHPEGTPADATWPGHPAGWRPYPGRAWTAGWVAWRGPGCQP